MDIINTENLEVFLTEELEYDREFTYKLFSTFKKYVDEIENEGFKGSEENVNVLMNMSHRLKSSCSSFGAKSLESQLENLEQAAASGKTDEVAIIYPEAVELAQKSVAELEIQIEKLLLRGEKSA